MNLKTEFYKLPLCFDLEQLKQEVSQFNKNDWLTFGVGGSSQAVIMLVAVGGGLNHDFAISGPMAPTAFLERCPYLKQVLTALETPISRARLVRFNNKSKITSQAENNYHWFRRMPVCIPIVTNPAIKFVCNGKSIHLAAAEAWVFDNSQAHHLLNETEQDCIHLLIETKGSSRFKRMLEPTTVPQLVVQRQSTAAKVQLPEPQRTDPNNLGGYYRSYRPDYAAQVPLEAYHFEVLTTPEIDDLIADILSELENNHTSESEFSRLVQAIETFRRQWGQAFAQFGHQHLGELSYRDLILDFQEQIVPKAKRGLQASGLGYRAINIIESMLLTSRPAPKRINRQLMLKKKRKNKLKTQAFQGPEFDRPLFIVSAPRAGSTLLVETLSRFPNVWTIGQESHKIIEEIPQLHPLAKDFSSNRLTQADAQAPIVSALKQRFAQQLQDREGRAYQDYPVEQRPAKVRFLEKTPKNALRIPFLKAAFPKARFIYIYRDPQANISSLIEGWRSQRFVAYRPLPGWPYREWKFYLPPGWSSLQNCSLAEIAAYQWKMANTYILDDLRTLPPSSSCLIRYSDLIQEPDQVINKVSQFSDLQWDQYIKDVVSRPLPISQLTLSTPAPDKWRKHEREISPLLPALESVINDFKMWEHTYNGISSMENKR